MFEFHKEAVRGEKREHLDAKGHDGFAKDAKEVCLRAKRASFIATALWPRVQASFSRCLTAFVVNS
jgi:hypothetical protein